MVNMSSAPFTSNKDDWSTPQDFYDMLNLDWRFNLDPCASHDNHKCSKYFTIEDDGLKQSWIGYRVFMNPPYSQTAKWIEKAYNERQLAYKSKKPETVIACLIASRTDTKYWHKYVMKADLIYFVRGRLKFGNAKHCAPFPSSLVVFSSRPLENYTIIESLERR